MVDLDLDVILGRDGSLVLDDEDEFDKHRVTLDYPADVVARARRAAADLMAAAGELTCDQVLPGQPGSPRCPCGCGGYHAGSP